jgi:hypothetical protein
LELKLGPQVILALAVESAGGGGPEMVKMGESVPPLAHLYRGVAIETAISAIFFRRGGEDEVFFAISIKSHEPILYKR